MGHMTAPGTGTGDGTGAGAELRDAGCAPNLCPYLQLHMCVCLSHSLSLSLCMSK